MLLVLPARIEQLRRELASLEAALADASLHERDPQGFRRTTGIYAGKRTELEKAEHDWLELEILREEVEGAAVQ
jgi:ATP-binding cassette subfamily F protein uup